MKLGPIMLDLEHTELTTADQQLLQHPQVGGVILFSRNYVSVQQLTCLIKDIRSVRPELLIAVDQEGGRVQRFVEGFTQLPAAGIFAKQYKNNSIHTLAEVETTAYTMASELIALGIDISFAPVLDINYGFNTVIGDRSFGDTAELVTQMADAYICGMNRAGMQGVGKHFPGHGSVSADSHLHLPVDERDYATISQSDLVPFAQLINQLGAVMSAHVVYKKHDTMPASFSAFWLQTVLRDRLNFKGAVFSDDLTMQAAASVGSYSKRVQAALAAGCDMVLVCNNQAALFEILQNLDYAISAESEQRLFSMQAKPMLV